MFVCERSFRDPLTYLLRIQVQKCGYQFIPRLRKAGVLDTPELKRRLESDRGKERDKSSVEREISDIIIKDFRSIIGYEVSDIPEGKKKPKIKFWIRKKNEEKRDKSFGKLIIFTDKSEWHSKKIVQTYNNKYLVEDDFKLLNDELLVPIGAQYIIEKISISESMFFWQLLVYFFIDILHGKLNDSIYR